MPKQIRDFKRRLKRAGYVERLGKGSHGTWKHPLLVEHIVVAYQDEEDTPRYLEKQLTKGTRLLAEMEKPEEET